MTEPLRYPNEIIEKTTDYLKINVVEYNRHKTRNNTRAARNVLATNKNKVTDDGSGYATTPKEKREWIATKGYTDYGTSNVRAYNNSRKEYKESIYLPIPSNIQDSNSINWGDSSLDGLTAGVLSAVGDVFDKTNKSARKGKTFTEIIGEGMTTAGKSAINIVSTDAVAAHINRVIAASAARLPFGGNITASQLLARTKGQVINPNMELLFNGPTIRSFKFSFKMTPRDKVESDQIKQIINTFKKHMVPQIDYGSDSDKSAFKSGLYLNTPNIFELTYMQGNGPHPFLHKFKPCALTNMTVNYTGDGVYSTYSQGTPVSMIMDLGFKELEPIYSADYANEKEAGTGVGF